MIDCSPPPLADIIEQIDDLAFKYVGFILKAIAPAARLVEGKYILGSPNLPGFDLGLEFDAETRRWHDHVTKRSGCGLVSFATYLFNSDEATSARFINSLVILGAHRVVSMHCG